MTEFNYYQAKEQSWVDFKIIRGVITHPLKDSIGLVVHVKTDPRLEKFIRSMGDGKYSDVSNYGREWVAMDAKPINVYNLNTNKDKSDPINLSLSFPGHPLILTERFFADFGIASKDLANLGFLRIVGSSEEGGVRFGITGVYSIGDTERLLASITAEAKRLISEYMSPVSLGSRIYSR